ncbi:MAG: extracellular solute-binding protein [Treponema sp.]|nr:extracellular solute-binding protein [Treponema sp.]
MKSSIIKMNVTAAMLFLVLPFLCFAGGGSQRQSGSSANTFTVFAGINPLSPDNSQKPIVQQMNQAMEVNINWNCVTTDMLTERKNLILGTNDLPDAFMGADLTDYELITYGGDGVFIPLNKYINAQTMPNLMKILEQRPGALAAVTMPDGNIYSLPRFEEMGIKYKDGKTYGIGAIPQFTVINQDWLNKLGLKMPATIDEFHDVLLAFKTRDPNGNGRADEIPLTFIYEHWCAGMTSFFSAFGFTDYNENHRALVGDKVYYNAMRNEYRDAIRYFSQWFKEGLIDVEVFSQDDSQYIAKGKGTNVIVGSYVWWEIPEVVGYDRASMYTYLSFLSNATGSLNVNLNEQGTIAYGSFAVTRACKNPELLLKWVDQVYEPKMSMQALYGPIGVFFESQPDSKGVYINKNPPVGTTEGELKAMNELLGPVAQLSEHYGTIYYMEDRAQERLNDLSSFWFNKVTDFNYYPSVIFTMPESEILNDKLTDIKSYTSEMTAKWLMNGGVDQEWDAYITQLRRMGIDDVVKAWQSAYDRYKVNQKVQ